MTVNWNLVSETAQRDQSSVAANRARPCSACGPLFPHKGGGQREVLDHHCRPHAGEGAALPCTPVGEGEEGEGVLQQWVGAEHRTRQTWRRCGVELREGMSGASTARSAVGERQ